MLTIYLRLNITLCPLRSEWQLAIASFGFRTYAEITKTLTPSPSPIKGEGNKKISFTPLLPLWEKGLGDEGKLGFA